MGGLKDALLGRYDYHTIGLDPYQDELKGLWPGQPVDFALPSAVLDDVANYLNKETTIPITAVTPESGPKREYVLSTAFADGEATIFTALSTSPAAAIAAYLDTKTQPNLYNNHPFYVREKKSGRIWKLKASVRVAQSWDIDVSPFR